MTTIQPTTATSGRVYDMVKSLLIEYPRLRDSDKLLLWAVWNETGLIKRVDGELIISFQKFMDAVTPETVTRCRRKIQEKYPSLLGSRAIVDAREAKAKTKGTFIFQENLT